MCYVGIRHLASRSELPAVRHGKKPSCKRTLLTASLKWATEAVQQNTKGKTSRRLLPQSACSSLSKGTALRGAKLLGFTYLRVEQPSADLNALPPKDPHVRM